MRITNKREILILLAGDTSCFFLALLSALVLRTWEMPSLSVFISHLYPFSVIMALSIAVFFIAGLYEKHTIVFQDRLPGLLFNAQIANALIAVGFFYLVPSLGINPKTILFLYLVTSFLFICLWRLYGRRFFESRKRLPALLIGTGEEFRELLEEVNNNRRYPFVFKESIDFSAVSVEEAAVMVKNILTPKGIAIVIFDIERSPGEQFNTALSASIRPGVAMFDFSNVYEAVFDRVALGSFNPSVFTQKVSSPSHALYDMFRRSIDLIFGFLLTIIGIFLYPIIYSVIKIEDGGPVFIPQIRIGERGERVKVYKLRTMKENNSRSDKWLPEEKSVVTRVGRLLRRLSFDEVPQVFNVFQGTMSLIGPRADIEGLGKRLQNEIPNYTLRTLVRPGISGWAQIQQIYKKGNISPQSIEETKLRLAYDLYYIKNRSFLIDLKIVLRTITILLSRLGI